jgi:hypothetical protein
MLQSVWQGYDNRKLIIIQFSDPFIVHNFKCRHPLLVITSEFCILIMFVSVNKENSVRFQVLTAVSMKMTALWDVVLCSFI